MLCCKQGLNMDLYEFENVKISALSKAKSINQYVNNVTIGPNSTVLAVNISNNCENEEKSANSRTKQTNPKNVLETKTKQSPRGKMLAEIEAQIKDEIQASIRSRIEKMQKASQELNANCKSEWVKKQQILIEQSQQQEDFMLRVLEEHDRKAVDHLQQLQLQYQKQAEERNKRNLEIQLKEKQRHQLLLVIESIQKQQHAFRLIYQDILVILKECHNLNFSTDQTKFAIITNTTLKMKTLLENMDKIKEKCKAGIVSTVDFELAIALVQEANKLKIALQQVFANKLEEDKKQAVIEKPAPLPEQQKPIITHAPVSVPDTTDSAPHFPAQTQPVILNQPHVQFQPPPLAPVQFQPPPLASVQFQPPPLAPVQFQPPPLAPAQNQPSANVQLPNNTFAQNEQYPAATIESAQKATMSVVETFISKNSLKMYSHLQQYLETYKESLAQLVSDPRYKQFRFHCQKAVNIPLNAISAVSSQHLMDKYQRLSNLLRGNAVEAGGTNVVSSQHPQGVAFCTDLLARKIVLQGDLLISSNPESAHCYAAVMVALWNDFPDFGTLVLAYFYQIVPYIVPFYPPKIEDQTDQDYYVNLGYLYVDGQVEKQDKFLKRMSGIMRLYAAVTISRIKRGQHGPHPHGIACAWKWLANTLNMDPRSDITATLLFDFLEVTGSSLQASYGGQFQKVLYFISDVYLQKMRQIDSGGPVTRLEVLLQKIKKNGHIEPPKGRLPEGFW